MEDQLGNFQLHPYHSTKSASACTSSYRQNTGLVKVSGSSDQSCLKPSGAPTALPTVSSRELASQSR